MVDVFLLRSKCGHMGSQAKNVVTRELRYGEGDDRVLEQYTHVPAMNRMTSHGIMRPALPKERMVSPVMVTVSSKGRGNNTRLTNYQCD
jgi:hypothetical protein